MASPQRERGCHFGIIFASHDGSEHGDDDDDDDDVGCTQNNVIVVAIEKGTQTRFQRAR